MKVGFLASNFGRVDQPWKGNSRSLMEDTGNNIGNMAFWYATDLLVDAEKVLVNWHTKAVNVPKGVEALVIPAANFINATANLDGVTALIRDLDVPCLLIGIGVQADREDLPPARNESVVSFLEAVSKRTSKIGVRGEYTKKICVQLGIDNTISLGCPSILINSSRNLGETIERRINNPTIDVGPYAVHASCVKHLLTSTERELARYVMLNPGSTYVVQRPIELIKQVYGEELSETELVYYRKCADFFGFANNKPAFDRFLAQHLYAPTSIDSWMHYLGRFAAGINTRIHGTIVGISAGLPSICINHDTRTRELSKRVGVPNIETKDFMETRYSFSEMFKRAQFSGRDFEDNRSSIAAAYVDIFKDIGLVPSRHLLSFLSG